VRLRGPSWPVQQLRSNVRVRGGRRHRRRGVRRLGRRALRRREDLPVQDHREGAVVNTSIIWESRGARSLFGRDGVSGLANVDITPEFAVKVAMAYGTSIPEGRHRHTSRDSSRAARMLKRAMMAGLNATGVDVLDLEVASVPVTRFLARSPGLRRGLTIRLDQDDPESVVIRFFDTHGTDISEDAQRKIERLFQREDFRRALSDEIGDIGSRPAALEEYAVALEATVDPAAISEAQVQGGGRLLVRHRAGVMPNVLAKLGADVLAVNPYASTGGMLTSTRTHAVERVASLVRASGRIWARCSTPTASTHVGRRPRSGPHRHRGDVGVRGARL
jgi:mannose-1-phosphate guanylyltransferase / phosphomannomutase